jgi:hypothetical protein
MLETYINEFIHLYCSSFLKITETEPNRTEVFLFQKKLNRNRDKIFGTAQLYCLVLVQLVLKG